MVLEIIDTGWAKNSYQNISTILIKILKLVTEQPKILDKNILKIIIIWINNIGNILKGPFA